MSEETHKKETGPAGLSWLTVEGFILAIAAVLSLIPGIREMIDNEYLARGMRQTAQLMFAAEYWSMFQILFPLGQVFLFFLWRFSKRLPTFGQTLGFTALYFGSMGLIQVVSTLVILNIMVNNISRFEMLVHNFPAPVGAAMGQIADYMFQPLQLQPLYLIKFLSLAPVPLLTYVAVHLGFGLLLATTIWQGVRYYRAARQGLKLPKEKRSIQLPPVSRRHWWIFLVILLPVTVAWIDEPAENNVAFGHPNILLISIDTLRADHVGCYGHTRDTTPMIDHLASEGMIFDRAISQAPTRTIGNDSNCPMVAPAKRKPRCASGWRKNSPMIRATPYPARNAPDRNPRRARSVPLFASSISTAKSAMPSMPA